MSEHHGLASLFHSLSPDAQAAALVCGVVDPHVRTTWQVAQNGVTTATRRAPSVDSAAWFASEALCTGTPTASASSRQRRASLVTAPGPASSHASRGAIRSLGMSLS